MRTNNITEKSAISNTPLTVFLLLCLSLLAMVPLAAWGQSSDLVKVRYVISHRSALLGSLPSYIAVDKGLFEKHGVEVEFSSGGGGGTTLRLLSTGNVDIAEGGMPAAILAAKTGPNIELVGAWYSYAGVMVWIAPKSKGISSLSGLEGAKLGYSHAGSASQWLSQEGVSRAGIDNVSFVSVGGMGDNWVAAKGGVITAGWAMEPFLSEKITNDNAEIILNPGKYIKHYYLEGIDVSKAFAEEHPEAVKGVFEGLLEAVDFIRENPEAAAELATQHYDFSKDVLLAGIKSYVKHKVWSMKVDPKGYETIMQGMVDTGQLDAPIDMGALLNQSYLPKRLRAEFQ